MITFHQYNAISRSYIFHTITKPLISLQFGITGVVIGAVERVGAAVAGIIVRDIPHTPHILHTAANISVGCIIIDLIYVVKVNIAH